MTKFIANVGPREFTVHYDATQAYQDFFKWYNESLTDYIIESNTNMPRLWIKLNDEGEKLLRANWYAYIKG